MAQVIGPNQRKWLAALRSGEYRQGRHFLRTMEGSYCCLGVACDVLKIPFLASQGAGPRDLAEQLALRDLNGELSGERLGEHRYLTAANDGGRTFAEIADFCEAHPEAVFKEPR